MSGQDSYIDETILDDDSSQETSGNGFDVTLLELLTKLAYRWRFVAIVTGIAMLVGVLFCLTLQAKYTATTRIMTPQQTQSTSSMLMSQLAGANGASLASVATGGLALKSPNDIYIGLLGSRTVADAIIQEFDFKKVYGVPDMTAARIILSGHSTIVSEKNGFIAISYTDTDKQRAAAIANAYTTELRKFTKTLAVTEASQRRLFYEEQLKQANEALLASAVAFQGVQQKRGLVQLDAQARAMIESLALLRAQITAKQVEVAALRSYSTEHNPDVQLAEKELASLEAEQSRQEQSNHSPGFGEMGLGNVPSAGLEYLRAEHELQYHQALYDMLMKQYDAARLDESKEGAVIQVVELAIPPDRKIPSHRALIVLAFAALGLFGACAYLYVLVAIQRSPKISQSLAEFKAALFSR